MTSNVSMFTDDTHIFVYDAIVDEVEDHLNSELERIHQWLLVNKLTLNKDKTEYVIIGSIATQRLLNIINDPKIELGGTAIKRRVKHYRGA